MYVVTVNFTLKAGQEAAFLPLMLENASASLKKEPGCRQFDVCTDPARPDEVFLYEVYDDPAAFQDHLASPHFLSFDALVQGMVEAKSVWTFREVWQ